MTHDSSLSELYITASVCSAGYYLINGAACTVCAAGKYQSSAGATACTDYCPAGKYGIAGKAKEALACIIYPIGKFSEERGAHVCTACHDGYFAASTDSTSCSIVPGGFTPSDYTVNIRASSIFSNPTDLTVGNYQAVQLTSTGLGSGMEATVVVSGPLSAAPDVLADETTLGNNAVTDATDGTYPSVELLGGSGSGAVVTVVVASGIISNITVTAAGNGYAVGDVLSIPRSAHGPSGADLRSANRYLLLERMDMAADSGTISQVVVTKAGVGHVAGDVLTFQSQFGGNAAISLVAAQKPLARIPRYLTDFINSNPTDLTPDGLFPSVAVVGASGTQLGVTVTGGTITKVEAVAVGLGHRVGDTLTLASNLGG
jgi:hypothetical protein